MSVLSVPSKPAAELKKLVNDANVAQTRANDFARAILLTLGVDVEDPRIRLDLEAGTVTIPDPPAPAAPVDPPAPIAEVDDGLEG
jgi:hypothetical protein